jgi:hypothetical protein
MLDDADVEVAVFDRARKVTLLERGAHRGILARRDTTAEHQSLGASADRGMHGPDEDIARAGLV